MISIKPDSNIFHDRMLLDFCHGIRFDIACNVDL